MAWDEAQAFPNELIGKLAAMGLMGIQVSEDEGGFGDVGGGLLHLPSRN